MGLTKEQWNALPPAEQAQYRAQQSALDAERRRAAEARQAEQERLKAEEQRQERERVAALHQAARYGEIINVTIRGGQIAFFGRRSEYEPVSFDLVRGEQRHVEFPMRGNPGNISRVPVRLSEDGNTFYFDETAQNRIVITSEGWDRGRSYQPREIPLRDGWSQAVGITIGIRFKEVPRQPARIIIEKR